MSNNPVIFSQMMSAISPEFQKEMEDEQEHLVAFPTGFNTFDIMGANIEPGIYGGGYVNAGFFPRVITVVGESGVGKSTALVQTLASMVQRCGSFMQVYDMEQHLYPERIRELTHWSKEQFKNHCRYKSGARGMVEVYNDVRRIVALKEKMKKTYGDAAMITTGMIDYDGNLIKVFPPTPIIIDSIPSLLSNGVESLEYDKDGNVKDVKSVVENIDAARDAKVNTNFIKKIKPLLSKYNIPLIMINHITEQMITGPFEKPKKFHPNFKPGQMLKGGKEMVYQSFGLFDIHGKEPINERYPIYGDRINGNIVQVRWVKSKSSASGSIYRLVFDKKEGYKAELSDFEYIYGRKYGFSGSPASYRLDILPEVSFTRKSLLEKCETNPLFARALNFTARLCMLSDIIYTIPPVELKFLVEQLSEEERYALVISNSSYYPFYENRGLVLPEELEVLPDIIEKESVIRKFSKPEEIDLVFDTLEELEENEFTTSDLVYYGPKSDTDEDGFCA